MSSQPLERPDRYAHKALRPPRPATRAAAAAHRPEPVAWVVDLATRRVVPRHDPAEEDTAPLA